jgi:hypothetical protein
VRSIAVYAADAHPNTRIAGGVAAEAELCTKCVDLIARRCAVLTVKL